MIRRVILESPFAGDVEGNKDYARRCLRDSLFRGEAPMASHLLYTEALDDLKPGERARGIDAGHAWLAVVDAVVAYLDKGISSGMDKGLERAMLAGVKIEYRLLAFPDCPQDVIRDELCLHIMGWSIADFAKLTAMIAIFDQWIQNESGGIAWPLELITRRLMALRLRALSPHYFPLAS